MMTAPTSTARSVRTTLTRVPATRIAGFIARRAGRKAKLCYMGRATMENRHGLAVAGRVTHANGTAERRASETTLKVRRKAAGRRITAGEDKAYDTADHVIMSPISRHRRDAACDTEPGRHQNRQEPQQRHRRTHHAASGIWHVAIAPGDGRVHFRMGQAAWHHAQDQTSWHRSGRRRLPAQSDCL